MKKIAKRDNVIKVRSVVIFPSHPQLKLTVEMADHMTGRACVVWFNKDNVLMKATVEVASLVLVR
jgi:hypothetical protein